MGKINFCIFYLVVKAMSINIETIELLFIRWISNQLFKIERIQWKKDSAYRGNPTTIKALNSKLLMILRCGMSRLRFYFEFILINSMSHFSH